jgi:hypothetical protein
MTEIKERTGTDGSHVQGSRRWVVAGLLAAAVIVIAAVAFASRPSNPVPVVPMSDQRAAANWAQQNAQMWSWMQSPWDEMVLMHKHWGDNAWMQTHLADWNWMRDHWEAMAWMHTNWQGMAWMHTGGMMGVSAPGG